MSDLLSPDRAPSWLELESVRTMLDVQAITSLSEDAIKLRYPHFIVRLSPRRIGMKLRNALAIANGDYEADACIPISHKAAQAPKGRPTAKRIRS